MNTVNGVYLPIITPFKNGHVDLQSYKELLKFYLAEGIHGLVPFGTTGELPTLEEEECDAILEASIAVVKGRIPIFIGLSSNSTAKAIKQVQHFGAYQFDGFLVASPYYNLPSQDGIVEHYQALSRKTDKKILLYNIPHRTGRNLTNSTITKLMSLSNIVGIKDTCGNVSQTIELLREKGANFSIFTGDDLLYFLNVVSGGNGGILASAHFKTDKFIHTWELIQKNDLAGALTQWNNLSRFIPILFQEPSPGPIKYVLEKRGLISSSEMRLPMTNVSGALAKVLDEMMEEKII